MNMLLKYFVLCNCWKINFLLPIVRICCCVTRLESSSWTLSSLIVRIAGWNVALIVLRFKKSMLETVPHQPYQKKQKNYMTLLSVTTHWRWNFKDGDRKASCCLTWHLQKNLNEPLPLAVDTVGFSATFAHMCWLLSTFYDSQREILKATKIP